MPSLSKADYIAAGREIAQRIDDARGEHIEVESDRIVNMAHVPLVHAYSSHTLRLGEVALELYERGLNLEAVPTVRAAYEAALTASWLADSREALSAVYNEEIRQRKALTGAMERANSVVFREGATDMPYLDTEQLESAANAQARQFQALCHSLHPGGHDAYVIYRAMSAFAHPSTTLADNYLAENDGEAGVTLLADPNGDDDWVWLPILVASILWAARALDVMDRDRPNRNFLREMARHLQVAEVLRLSQEALQAEREAEQERRRSAWRGPRPKKRGRAEGDVAGGDA